MKLFTVLQTSFENFDSTIKSYLSKVLGSSGKQYSYSQIFGALYDGIKSVMQNVMFYIEDALTEQNIKTAYRKSSIYSLAKLSGYEPYYGSAAVGIIQCNIVLNAMNNVSNKIYIKNGSSIIDNNSGNIYSVQLSTDYLPIDASKPLFMPQFKVVQGTWKNTAYVSKGDKLETINITTQGLYDTGYIEVKVDGVQYSPAASLYDMEKDGLQYVISSGYDNELDIMFGNGVHGKQLNEGQTISIKYLIHDGISGNLSKNSDYDLVFRDPVYDDEGNKVNDFYGVFGQNNNRGRHGADKGSEYRNDICDSAYYRHERRVGYVHEHHGDVIKYAYDCGVNYFTLEKSAEHFVGESELVDNCVCRLVFENAMHKDFAFFGKHFSSGKEKGREHYTDYGIF